MDMRALQIFIEVAELKSFTRAGERLGYSQPTVSFQIRQLEQELGVPLFDRIGHTVTLTEAGQKALAYAHRICNLSREMTAGAREEDAVSGMIRVGMADSLCFPMIARDFDRIRREYPGISLQIFAAGTGELFRMLDHNEVDLVCTMDSRIYNASYIAAAEEAIGAHFVAAAESPLGRQENCGLEDLLAQPFLLTEKGMSYRRLMDEKLAARGLEIQPVLETSRADLICDLVAKNMGISFLPDYVTQRHIRKGALKILEVPDFQVEVWKQLLYRRDKWLSPQMKVMLRHLSRIHLQDKQANMHL